MDTTAVAYTMLALCFVVGLPLVIIYLWWPQKIGW